MTGQYYKPAGATKMTPRETVIEAMARTILLNGYPTPEGKTDDEHFTFIRLTNPTWWYIALEHSTNALDALLAALPTLGLKVVPVQAEVDMLVAGTEDWLCIRAQEDRAEAIWSAMLAAAPDLLVAKP